MSLHSDIIVKHEKCHFLEKEHEYILREFSGWPIDQSTYGLVHYDLHQGNILKTNSDTYTIDFDDLCYHWYIWDFAIIWHRLSSGFMMQDQQHLKEIFLQGYRTQTELTQFFEEKLNFMERARHFYMLNWLAYRKDEYKWSQIAEKYLQRYMLYLEEKHSL